MGHKRLGKQPPRYTFLLNPHADVRLSRCPACERLTYPRKFPLLIFVGDVPMTLGKTCKYCSRCEMIMCQQDELEAELAIAFARNAPDMLGREYLVMGTVARAVWKAGMKGDLALEGLLANTADFRKYSGLAVTPGGWYAAGHEPAPLASARPQRVPLVPPPAEWN